MSDFQSEITRQLGSLVAQSMKHPTLDFGSGRGLGVVGSRPVSGSMLGVEST